MEKRSTGHFDKTGQEVFEGDKLHGKTIDGNNAIFNVKWSDYRNSFIGENPDEIYDISPSKFHHYKVV